MEIRHTWTRANFKIENNGADLSLSVKEYGKLHGRFKKWLSENKFLSKFLPQNYGVYTFKEGNKTLYLDKTSFIKAIAKTVTDNSKILDLIKRSKNVAVNIWESINREGSVNETDDIKDIQLLEGWIKNIDKVSTGYAATLDGSEKLLNKKLEANKIKQSQW